MSRNENNRHFARLSAERLRSISVSACRIAERGDFNTTLLMVGFTKNPLFLYYLFLADNQAQLIEKL